MQGTGAVKFIRKFKFRIYVHVFKTKLNTR